MLVPEGAGIDRPFNFWNMRSSKESRKKGTLGWWVMLQGSYVNTVKALRRHSFALPNCGNEQFCPCFSFSTFMGRTGVVYMFWILCCGNQGPVTLSPYSKGHISSSPKNILFIYHSPHCTWVGLQITFASLVMEEGLRDGKHLFFQTYL